MGNCTLEGDKYTALKNGVKCMDDMRFNSERYRDPTAYLAMISMVRKEKKKRYRRRKKNEGVKHSIRKQQKCKGMDKQNHNLGETEAASSESAPNGGNR